MKRVLAGKDCECWVCGRKFPYFGEESPMLKDEIWQQIAKDEPEIQYYSRNGDTWIAGGFLCKDCMEKRLGRSIKYEDLMTLPDGSPVPFNKWYIEKYFPEKA